MNREELIKMFNDKFKELWIQSDLHQRWVLRDFIFDTIIPEVLRSIIPELQNTQTNDDEINSMRYWSNDCIYFIKQISKELYNINL